VLAQRSGDVLRIAFARGVRGEMGEALRWAAARRVPCDETSEAELEHLSGSPHHEGLCVVARPRAWRPIGDLLESLLHERGAAIALDRVRNPYNVGAILRSAAFFGIEAAILGAPAPHPALAPTAVRVAEGGAELLALARTTDLAETLARARARGITVVGTDNRASMAAFDHAFARPLVLVVGHEREGLTDRVRRQCDALLAIPGGGAVDSLNVAVASGIVLALVAGAPAPPFGTVRHKT
jgi:TrmH RNA methyltransferase